MQEKFKTYLQSLPNKPGCYFFKDQEGVIIYIGKAKNLKRRVASYFNRPHFDPKTRRLVSEIADLSFAVVESEEDALILENNLIKQHQPKFNILLKDAKNFQRILLTEEPFPRFVLSRKSGERSRTFGPFAGKSNALEILRLIQEVYNVRSCKYKLDSKGIAQGVFKKCLKHDLELCRAPCIGLIDEEEYNLRIQEAVKLLRGEVNEAIFKEEQEMHKMSELWNYEAAELHRYRAELLRLYKAKHEVAPNIEHSVAAFAHYFSSPYLFVCMLLVTHGSVQAVYCLHSKAEEKEIDEIFTSAIVSLCVEHKITAYEALLPHEVDWLTPGKLFSKISIPIQGAKRALVELAYKNARDYATDFYVRCSLREEAPNWSQKSLEIQHTLGLSQPPWLIDCFDNSHLQGEYPVSVCVTFKNGAPWRSRYRRFKIKDSKGGDDYASMREAVRRRYKSLLEKGEDLPQLVVIDGGKGQLHAAIEILRELELEEQIEICALAEKEEEVFLPGLSESLRLSLNSSTLKTLQQIRDEAHRFVLSYHQKLRSKGLLRRELLEIKGIGERTEQLLLQRFGTPASVKAATEEEIQSVLGDLRGKKIYRSLHSQGKEEEKHPIEET